MSALRISSAPTEEALRQLRASIDIAYEHVQMARRHLAASSTNHELSAFLQSAEADLVRAMVAAGQIENGPLGARVGDKPVPISQRQSSLPRTA